jgi:hypothetical protein
MRLAQDPAYRRLRGARRTTLGNASYWLARDHLLIVDVVWYVENYRRFELHEIEALVIRPTSVWKWALGALAFFAVAAGGLMLASAGEPGLLFTFGIFAGAALLALAYTWWWGPTGQILLRTSVQTIALPGLGRLKTIRRFAAEIQQAAQAAAEGGAGKAE